MSSTATRRDPRVLIYVAFDLLLAIVYVGLITQLAPPLRGMGNLFWLLVAVFVVIAIGMLASGRWGWRIAVGGCGTLLLLEVVLLVLILTSAAFLSGVYGSFGTGGAGMAVLCAVLSIQVIALVPALQLKFLMTRAGRRAFRQEPLWE